MRSPQPFLNKRQLAEHCLVTTRCIDNWIRDGIIPYLKIGRVVRFNLSEVEEALGRFRVSTRKGGQKK